MSIQDLFATVLVVSVMLAVGFDLRWRDLSAIRHQPGPLVRGLVFNHLGGPLLALGLAKLFAVPASTAAAMWLIAAVPGGPVGAMLVKHGRGNLALSVALVVCFGVFNTLATPLSLSFIADLPSADRLAFVLSTMRTVLLVVVVPLATGMLVRRHAPRVAAPAKKLANALANVLLIGLIVGVGGAQGHLILDFDLRTILAVASLVLLGVAGGVLVAGGDLRDRCAVGLTSGVRNIALALLLAPRVLDDHGQMVVLLYPVFVILLVTASMFGFRARIGAAPPHDAPSSTPPPMRS